jgi:excisionase family DNA binding protein
LNKMTVYRAVRDGTIPSVRVGDRFLIPRARLDAMLRGEVVAAGGAR